MAYAPVHTVKMPKAQDTNTTSSYAWRGNQRAMHASVGTTQVQRVRVFPEESGFLRVRQSRLSQSKAAEESYHWIQII